MSQELPKPVFVEWFDKRLIVTTQEISKAQELLCPADNSELREISNGGLGGAQCPFCQKVYIWRLDP